MSHCSSPRNASLSSQQVSADSEYDGPLRHMKSPATEVAMVQNQWYHFGISAPPILVYFSGFGMFTGGTGF